MQQIGKKELRKLNIKGAKKVPLKKGGGKKIIFSQRGKEAEANT